MNKGIGALRLGLTPGGVRQLLGKPNSTAQAGGTFLSFSYERRYGLSVLFSRGPASPFPASRSLRAEDIDVTSSIYRTVHNLHVGSSLADVESAFPGIACGPISGGGPSTFTCNLGAGSHISSFVGRSGRVRSIEIG